MRTSDNSNSLIIQTKSRGPFEFELMRVDCNAKSESNVHCKHMPKNILDSRW